MKRFGNWLLQGTVEGNPQIQSAYPLDDAILCITPDSLYAFTTKLCHHYISALICRCQNVNIYNLSKDEQNDSDKFDIAKVSQFYFMVSDKKTVGITISKPKKGHRYYEIKDTDKYLIKTFEKWPMIASYAIEQVAGIFFTLKHKVLNIRKKLKSLIGQPDSYCVSNYLIQTVKQAHDYFKDSFEGFSSANIGKRQMTTEDEFSAGLYLPFEFSELNLTEERKNRIIPFSRILFGGHSNAPYNEKASPMLLDHFKQHPNIHMTTEFSDPYTGYRWARSYFLWNGCVKFFEDIRFSHKTEPDDISKNKEYNQKAIILMSLYISLCEAFAECANPFITGYIDKEEFSSKMRAQISHRINTKEMDLVFQEELIALEYDAEGRETIITDKIKGLIWKRKIRVIRYKLGNIKLSKEDLGSLIISDSFLKVGELILNISRNIPYYNNYMVSARLYPLINFEFHRVKVLKIKDIGKNPETFEDVIGFIELNSSAQENIKIFGSIILYPKGLIFNDKNLSKFPIKFEWVKSFIIYITNNIYFRFIIDPDRLPYSQIGKGIITIKLPQKFITTSYQKYLNQLGLDEIKFQKVTEKIVEIENFEKDISEISVTGLQSPNFITINPISKFIPEIDELRNYLSITELTAYLSKSKLSFENYKKILDYELKEEQVENRKSVFIVCGIPGSGKSMFADSLKRYSGESENFIIEKIESESIEEKNKEITAFISKNEIKVKNIILIISGFTKIRELQFILKSNTIFNSLCIIRIIISIISKNTFYRNPNKQFSQFLLENCAFGVSNFVVMNCQGEELEKLTKKYNVLKSMNEAKNIIMARRGKVDNVTVKLILEYIASGNKKFYKLFNERLYAFSKEGHSKYINFTSDFSPFLYRFDTKLPIQLNLAKNALSTLNLGKIYSLSFSKPLEVKPLKENVKKAFTLAEEMARMEEVLTDYMGLIKSVVKKEAYCFESIKGTYTVENNEFKQFGTLESSWKICNSKANENSSSDIRLGFTFIGFNLNLNLIKENLLKLRSHLIKILPMKTLEDFTNEEIVEIEKLYRGKFVPQDYIFDGESYIDQYNKKLHEHPNRSIILKDYLLKENKEITEKNKIIEKELAVFKQTYEF